MAVRQEHRSSEEPNKPHLLWEKVSSLLIGLLIIGGDLYLVLKGLHPSRLSYLFFVSTLPLGIALVSTLFLGNLTVRTKRIAATGGFGVLVLQLWFITKMSDQKSENVRQDYTLFLKNPSDAAIDGLKGEINMRIGNENRPAPIHDGLADFKQLPEDLLDSAITLELRAKGWLFRDSHTTSLHYRFVNTASTLFLEPDSAFYKVCGTVYDLTNNDPLSGVHIQVGDLSVTTDSNGRFLFYMPIGRPGLTAYIDIIKPGYKDGKEKIDPEITRDYSIYLMRRK